MIRSMTAFGRGEHDAGGTLITVEMRTVNHRYRDISLRLPSQLQPLEEDLRGRVAAAIGRGKVDLTLTMDSRGEQPDFSVELNEKMAEAYIRLFRGLQDRYGADPSFTAESLCRFKDIVVVRPVERDTEGLKTPVLDALEKALEAVDHMRVEEGRAIESDFRHRLELIRERVQEINARAPAVVEEYRARLREKIAAVAEGVEIDENRLAQEAAYLAGRCDVTEEVVRTLSHLDRFEEYLGEKEPVGRRLDFLLQEMNREVNTISSKASDISISRASVEIKGEIEKIREQVQNVE